ncbi:murein DD-endopeptidase [Metapseudomonas resinovorans]|uniref:C40 family peptidase n=1 Tax=Metapseudomonas resinovorans TaxID=53412 RepID=UPI003D25C45E
MFPLYRCFVLSISVLIGPFAFADDFNRATRPAKTSGELAGSSAPARSKPLSPSARERIVARAHELVGHRYKWGGTSVETGFDCSGLLFYLYRSVANLHLPRTTQAMLARREATVSHNELQPGDAVFFSHNGSRRSRHVGLYIGDGRFIHAPSTGKTIRINSLKEQYWKKNYLTARSFRG